MHKANQAAQSEQSAGWIPAWSPQNLFAFSFTLFLFAILSSITYLWHGNGFFIFPSGRYALIPCAIIFIFGLIEIRRREIDFSTLLAKPLAPAGVGWALIVLFLSDWLSRPYNLFQGPSIRGEVLCASGIALLALRTGFSGLFLLLPFAGALIAWSCFLIESNGRLLISDDHATFFYRLTHLKEQFPFIPFYHPLWNAGIDERAFFATGSLNIFLLFSPLVYLFDISLIYNFIICLLLFLIAPLLTGYSSYRMTGDRLAAFISASLILTPSLHWFKWSLKYGTLGFVTSSVLLPLNVLYCCLILFAPERFTRRDAVIAFFSITLMLFWSPAGLVFLPLIVLGLFRLHKILRYRHITTLLLALTLANAIWVAIFWDVSRVSTFLSSESATEEVIATGEKEDLVSNSEDELDLIERSKSFRHAAGTISIKESIRIIRETAHSTHPLLLLFGLPCIVMLPRGLRIGMGLVAVWLLLFGSILVPLKPQLELDRMLVILQILLCIPAGAGIAALWHHASVLMNSKERLLQRVAVIAPALLSAGFLLTGPLVTGSIVRNRSVEHYTFIDDKVESLIAFIEQYPASGRLLFSGCVTHDLNGGHLAPLSVRTGKPLIASSQVGDIWWYKDVIPLHFLKQGDEGKERFFNLQNITGIFAHDHKQIRYFRKHPEKYEAIWSNDKFVFFERKNYSSNYFLEGKGTIISQENEGVLLRLDTSEAVIKFNYFPFLKADGCSIAPYPVEGDIVFIKLEDCSTGSQILLQSVDPFTRIFS